MGTRSRAMVRRVLLFAERRACRPAVEGAGEEEEEGEEEGWEREAAAVA